MKKKLVLFSALLTLVAFATVTGCKREDDDYYFYGNVTFWNNDASLNNIIVTVDGSQSDRIGYVGSPSYCNETGFANFYLSEGTHYYSARTTNGIFLGSDNFYVNSDCRFIYIP
jgi:hypothetical protein